MFGAIGLAFALERSRLGGKISGVVLTISLGLILSNTFLIPHASPLYDVIGGYLVPLAIPLLLFKADLRGLWREGGLTALVFLFAAAGSVIGAFVAAGLLDLGSKEAIIAGMLAATYIGGSMNLVAVSQAAGLNDPAIFAAAVAADNIAGTTFLLLLGAYAASGPARRLPAGEDEAQATATIADEEEPFRISDLTIALAISGAICVVSGLVADALGRPEVLILMITGIAALVANLFPRIVGKLSGTFEAGMLLFAMFFFVIGAGAEVRKLAGAASLILVFAAIIILFSAFAALIGGKLLKAGRHETAIACNASVLGPPTAAAMAAGIGRRDLVAPGLLCGVFGYVIGTFIGLAVTALLGG